MPSVASRRAYAAANARAMSARANSAPSATSVSSLSVYAVEPGSVSSARLIALTLAQALLECLELRVDRSGQPVTEASEMLLGLVELGARLVEIDLQGLRRALAVEGAELERVDRGDVPQRRLVGLRPAVAAAEDPGQHARVLAEAGPQEPAVCVLAEPVDVEDLGQLRAVALGQTQ